MANDRYRERNWDRTWDERRRDRSDFGSRGREDDGYIARHGFGNERSGYSRRPERGRERDFGDSAGYGSGGSALDWNDVVGDERGSERSRFTSDWDRDRDWGYPRSGSPMADSSYGREQDRYGSGYFGRGSRDYAEDRGFFERAGDEVRSWFGDEEAERRRERDMREGPYHRGRGPKGYQRSDERILEDVNDRLTDDPHIDASEIDVNVANREVTLNGTVNSRFEKRHAEDLAESVSGVTHVQNNLRVQQPVTSASGMTGAGAAGAGSVGTLDKGDISGQTRRRTASTPSGT